jgi:hypothetical protein
MEDIRSWSKQQNYLDWQRTVEMANQWRRMMNIPEVAYPYPGDPRERISVNAPT